MFTIALLVLLMATVGVAIISESWYRSILALACQYVIGFALASEVASAEVLACYLISGGLTCAVLFVTMRRAARVAQDRRGVAGEDLRSVVGEQSYRIAALVLAAAVTYSIAESYSLPDLSVSLSFAVYWLAVAGIFSLSTSRRGLRPAIGIMLLTSSSQLLLSTGDFASVPVLFLSGTAVNILVVLGISYLLTGENLGRTLE